MSVKELVRYPESADAPRQTSKPVTSPSRRIRALLRDLKDALGAHLEGTGLAAPQIGAHTRLIAVRVGGRNPGTNLAPHSH